MSGQDQYASLRDVVKKLLKSESAAQIFAESNSDVSFEQIQDLEVLINNESPIAALEKDGRASELKYNLPASTEYDGLHFIILSAPGLQGPNYAWYNPQYVNPPQSSSVPPPPSTSSGSQTSSSSDSSGSNTTQQVNTARKSRGQTTRRPGPSGTPPLTARAAQDMVGSMKSMQGGM